MNRNVLYYEDINFMSNVKVMYHLISLGNRNYLYAFYCVPPELTMHHDQVGADTQQYHRSRL